MTILDIWLDSKSRLTYAGTRREVNKIARRIKRRRPSSPVVTYTTEGFTPSQVTVLQEMADHSEAELLAMLELVP